MGSVPVICTSRKDSWWKNPLWYIFNNVLHEHHCEARAFNASNSSNIAMTFCVFDIPYCWHPSKKLFCLDVVKCNTFCNTFYIRCFQSPSLQHDLWHSAGNFRQCPGSFPLPLGKKSCKTIKAGVMLDLKRFAEINHDSCDHCRWFSTTT